MLRTATKIKGSWLPAVVLIGSIHHLLGCKNSSARPVTCAPAGCLASSAAALQSCVFSCSLHSGPIIIKNYSWGMPDCQLGAMACKQTYCKGNVWASLVSQEH